MSGLAQHTDVVPACLSFLAIYNPALGRSEDTLDEQIVYYYAKPSARKRQGGLNENGQNAHDGHGKNERLRQVGLAQGMVEFAKSFSDDEAVDSIETEKSRIILHELENEWWILVSIDLTRLICLRDNSSSASSKPTTEFSAREVSPPALLLQQVLRAHRIFLLHHGSSLSELFMRAPRTKFCSILKRFWNDFVRNWDVLLSGNPAVDIFNGIKLAAGGELGIGVGEEDWGSGEREVLEGFIGRTEGLVDLMVSRFGEATAEEQNPNMTSATRIDEATVDQEATSRLPKPSDGLVFSGIGAISRTSTRAICHWVETLHTRHQDAYGVKINPGSTDRRKNREIDPDIKESESKLRNRSIAGKQNGRKHRKPSLAGREDDGNQQSDGLVGIPPSIIGLRKAGPQSVGTKHSSDKAKQDAQERTPKENFDDSETGTEMMIKYLTLGVYGSRWGIPFARSPETQKNSDVGAEKASNSLVRDDRASSTISSGQAVKSPGYFLVGFQGELEGETEDDDPGTGNDLELEEQREDKSQKSRIMIRTLHVERVKPQDSTSSDQPDRDGTSSRTYSDRLRVIVYVRQPFVFVFIFELQTDTLAIPAFYRSIHHQLGPLQRPLLTSTSPQKVHERLSEISLPRSTAATKSAQPICDLVYDPTRLTIHSSIPNIPEATTSSAERIENPESSWHRVEALNIHSQILTTYASTRRRTSELERTCKTSRGWWVVWMRLPHGSDPRNISMYREAFLIRKASDYVPPTARITAGTLGRGVGGSGDAGSWAPGKLAEGIGIDARQYIEGLLSLNR